MSSAVPPPQLTVAVGLSATNRPMSVASASTARCSTRTWRDRSSGPAVSVVYDRRLLAARGQQRRGGDHGREGSRDPGHGVTSCPHRYVTTPISGSMHRASAIAARRGSQAASHTNPGRIVSTIRGRVLTVL